METKRFILLSVCLFSCLIFFASCDEDPEGNTEPPPVVLIHAKVYNFYTTTSIEVSVKKDSIAWSTASVEVVLEEPGEDAVVYSVTSQGDGTYSCSGEYIPGSTYTVNVAVEETTYSNSLVAPGDISFNSSSNIFTWTVDGNNDYIYITPSGGAGDPDDFAHVEVEPDIDSPYQYYYNTYWAAKMTASNLSTGGFSNDADPASTFEVYDSILVDFPPQL